MRLTNWFFGKTGKFVGSWEHWELGLCCRLLVQQTRGMSCWSMVHTDDSALLGMQVLVCAAELPFAHPAMCTYHRLPLVDNPSCDLRVQVPAAVDFIGAALAAGVMHLLFMRVTSV